MIRPLPMIGNMAQQSHSTCVGKYLFSDPCRWLMMGKCPWQLNILSEKIARFVQFNVLNDVLSSHKGTWLSFGMLGTIWTTSAAFDSMIEALDMAYDVECNRPFWKSRLLAIGLAAICGVLLLTALAVMVVGPRFGDWLADRLALSAVFVAVWPFLRWTIAFSFTVLAVEVLYFLAPNVKQRFGAPLRSEERR